MHLPTRVTTIDRRILVAGLGALLCAAAILRIAAVARFQAPRPETKFLQSFMLPVTPAQKARLDHISRLDNAAMAAMEAGRYAEAEADARQSMALGFASGLGQTLLAASLYAQGKTREALQIYQVIAAKGDSYPRNELPYALLLLKAGQWKQAVAAYNRALPHLSNGKLMIAHSHFSPDVPRPRELEAAIHIGLGLNEGEGWIDNTWPKILGQYRQALALEPDLEVARYYYAFGLWEMGQRGEAREAFRQVARESRDDIKAAAEGWLKPELVLTNRDPDGTVHRMVVMDTMPGPPPPTLRPAPTLAAVLRAAESPRTATTAR